MNNFVGDSRDKTYNNTESEVPNIFTTKDLFYVSIWILSTQEADLNK